MQALTTEAQNHLPVSGFHSTFQVIEHKISFSYVYILVILHLLSAENLFSGLKDFRKIIDCFSVTVEGTTS